MDRHRLLHHLSRGSEVSLGPGEGWGEGWGVGGVGGLQLERRRQPPGPREQTFLSWRETCLCRSRNAHRDGFKGITPVPSPDGTGKHKGVVC